MIAGTTLYSKSKIYDGWVLNLFWIIFLYFFVFQPPIVNKIYYVFFEFSFFFFYIFYKKTDFLIYLFRFKYEILFGFLIVLICFLRDLLSQEVVYLDRFLAWYFQCIFFPFVILHLYLSSKNKNKNLYQQKEFFYKLIYIVVVSAGILTLLLINFPALDDFYKGIQLDSYYEHYESFEVRYRAYGISENLTFTYGYLLGIYAGLAFLKSRSNILHLLFFVVLLMGVIYNARIGFIPISFMILYSLFFKPSKNYLILLFFSLCAFIYLGSSLVDEVSNRFNWAISFFTEIFGFLNGEDSHTMNYLFNEFIILPNGIYEIIFGTGESLFERKYDRSDIGYFIQFYYAGILFLLILVLLMTYLSLRLFKVTGINHWFSIVFCFSLFLLNTKGFVFAATPGARLLFLLYIATIYLNPSSNLSNKKI